MDFFYEQFIIDLKTSICKGSADINLEQDPIKMLYDFWSAETCVRS